MASENDDKMVKAAAEYTSNQSEATRHNVGYVFTGIDCIVTIIKLQTVTLHMNHKKQSG